MEQNGRGRPRVTLFCYDGSVGSQAAVRAGAAILGPRRVVVISVWQPLEVQARRAGRFGAAVPQSDRDSTDLVEEFAAVAASEEGARGARSLGYTATAVAERADSTVWQTILVAADDLDAELIVCGRKGRSAIRSVMLGSTSWSVLNHAHRPVLVLPEPSVPPRPN